MSHTVRERWHANCFFEWMQMIGSAAVGACLLLVTGCSGGSDDDSPGQPSGEVGSHVWSASSKGIEVMREDYSSGFGGPSTISRTCWSLTADMMDDAQRSALERVVLVPLTGTCTADGYTYSELTVVGSNGARSMYRDTGCSFLAAPGAKAMLPRDWSIGLILGEPAECR